MVTMAETGEQENIFNSPEPWISNTRDLFKKGIIMFFILFPFGLLFLIPYLLGYFPSDFSMIVYIMSIVFFGGGVLTFSIGLYGYVIHKDKWFLKLPFNRYLLNNLNIEIENMLKTFKINYTKKNRLELEKTNQNYSLLFKIAQPNIPEFSIDTLLTVIPGSPDEYYSGPDQKMSRLEITNICLENLGIIKRIADELYSILKKMNYQNYPNEN
jgi:hypothetical protein